MAMAGHLQFCMNRDAEALLLPQTRTKVREALRRVVRSGDEPRDRRRWARRVPARDTFRRWTHRSGLNEPCWTLLTVSQFSLNVGEHNVMPERKRMPSHAKRLAVRATRFIGTRRLVRAIPPRYQDDDLRVFRYMSKISRRVTAEEIDLLIGPA